MRGGAGPILGTNDKQHSEPERGVAPPARTARSGTGLRARPTVDRAPKSQGSTPVARGSEAGLRHSLLLAPASGRRSHAFGRCGVGAPVAAAWRA